LSNLKTSAWPGFKWKKDAGEASHADQCILEMSKLFAVTEESKKTDQDLLVIANGNSFKNIFSFRREQTQVTGQPDVLIMRNSGLEAGSRVVVIFELAHSNKWIDTHARKLRQSKALLIGAQRHSSTERPVLICSDLNQEWYLMWLTKREDQKGITSPSSFAPLKSPSSSSMPPPGDRLPPDLVTFKTQQIPKDKVIDLVGAIISGNGDPVKDRIRLSFTLFLPAQPLQKKPKRKLESQSGDDSKSDRDSESDSPKRKYHMKKPVRDSDGEATPKADSEDSPKADSEDTPKAKATASRGGRGGRRSGRPSTVDRVLRPRKKSES